MYSIDAGAFDTNEDVALIKKTKAILQIDSRFQINQFLISLYPFLEKYLKVSFSQKESVPFFKSLMENAIKTRVESKVQVGDYLEHFINLKNKKEIKLLDIAAHGATFLTDGYETSSIGISVTLYEVKFEKKT